MKSKIILSPCLLVVDKISDDHTQMEHYLNLSLAIDFITDYLRNSVEFDYFTDAPYEKYKINPPDYGEGTVLNNMVCRLFQKIQSMLSDDFIDLTKQEKSSPVDNYILPDHAYTETFLKYISYVLANRLKGLIFLGSDNYALAPFVKFIDGNINAVGDFQNEVYGNLRDILPIDKTNSIFPRSLSCKRANDIVKNKCNGLSKEEKRAIYIKYGVIIAERNLYRYDGKLSQLNTRKQRNERKVFKQENGDYYLSIDFESGGFELFDKHAKHMGQYNFSCNKVKDDSPSDHKLFLK